MDNKKKAPSNLPEGGEHQRTSHTEMGLRAASRPLQRRGGREGLAGGAYKWALLWALVILILCGIPGRDIPHISFLEVLSFDKFVHAGIFFVLILLTIRGFLLQTSFIKLQRSAKRIAFIVCVIYGGLLEIMQATLFEERSADVFDFIANSLGCVLGLVMYNWVEKVFLMKLIK